MSDGLDYGAGRGGQPAVDYGVRLGIITSGPSGITFQVKFATYDPDTDTTTAMPDTVAFTAYAIFLRHRDTLEDDAPDYSQPRLTTGSPVGLMQDYPGGTWLITHQFRPSTTTCP